MIYKILQDSSQIFVRLMPDNYTKRVRLLLLPYILGILLFVLIPASLSFMLAFFQYNALLAPIWSGKLNFILAYTDELFLLSVKNSIVLIILPVPLRVLDTFFVARLMQRRGPLLIWLRASIYLPSVIPAPAYALASLWILNPVFGPVNIFLRSFGGYSRLVC